MYVCKINYQPISKHGSPRPPTMCNVHNAKNSNVLLMYLVQVNSPHKTVRISQFHRILMELRRCCQTQVLIFTFLIHQIHYSVFSVLAFTEYISYILSLLHYY